MGMGAGSQETVLAGAAPFSDGATLTPSDMESEGGAVWEAVAASSAFSATMGCAAKNAHLREGLLLTGAVASGLWSNWEAIDGTVTPLVRIVAGAAPATADTWRKPYLTAVQPLVQGCLSYIVAQAKEGDKLRHECRIGHLPLWPVAGELPQLAAVSQSKSIGQVTRDACKCMLVEQGFAARLFNLPPESKEIAEILDTVFSEAHVAIIALCLSEAKHDTLL